MKATTVLDKGFIRLVDSMGDDNSVVRSARVSYGNETKGEAADKRLIKYLKEHKHGTPFEHIVFTFHIKCPIFVARQWFRQRIGSFNEISGRYVELKMDFWIPDEWRSNTEANKQSSGEGEFSEEVRECLNRDYSDALAHAEQAYEILLSRGVAREQARAILPLATYTEFYWSVNARSLFNFLNLRLAEDAQKEIRDYAQAIIPLVESIAPTTFETYSHNKSE